MRLVVQRGHYGRTTGSTGAPGEQQLGARIAQRITELAPDGVKVRVIDADEPRSRYAGDVFVALHADSSSSPSARGASVGYQTPEGRELASRWKACYLGRGWPGSFRADNYTANLSRYYGVRIAVATGNRRAVILEHGFLSNPAEKRWMTSQEGVDAAAAAVLEAVTGRRLIDRTPEPDEDAMTEEQARQLDELHRALCRDRKVAHDLRLLRLGVRAIAHKLGIPTKYDDRLDRVDA